MTELIWDGKYGPDGKKTRPVRVALPFQNVETVNESAQTRNLMLDLFARNQPSEWRNRLIWGDKKYVLPSLLPEFAGKVDLITIDPPFATGADFSFTATIPDDPDSDGVQSSAFVKQPSMIEQKAYRDTWGRGIDSYLQWFYETATLLHPLLADTGSIYVHIGPNVNHLIRACMDEVFGEDAFQSEIIWKRVAARSHAKGLPFAHDVILYYSRSSNPTWNPQHIPIADSYVKSHYTHVELDSGRRYRLDNVQNQNPNRPNLTYDWRGVTRTWRWTRENMQQLHDEGRLIYSKSGMPSYKRYLNESAGTPIQSVWTDIPPINSQAIEDSGYPTQKPVALLERIIQSSSNEGDLILDCFGGSGTSAVVAEKLDRRWIIADLGRFAIHTARKRLLAIPEVKPFVVQNLGKYERQAWQVAAFTEDSAQTRAALAQARYRKFILDLYHGTPIDGYNWLHGVKAGRYIHVGSVDAPVLVGDIKSIAQEFWKVAGQDHAGGTTSVDVLGWDFAFELNEMGRQMAADAGISMTFKRIPRDVMDRRAVEQGEITFFELAALAINVTSESKRVAQVELRDFIVPDDDVPKDVQQSITHWSQYIDYWAVDWNFRDDTFHNQWQSYRTKQQPKLELNARHTYEEAGTYTILVKVIDILGNDTTRAATVEVRR